jgi:hypothetical protein
VLSVGAFDMGRLDGSVGPVYWGEVLAPFQYHGDNKMAERRVSEETGFLEATPKMGLDTGQPAPGQAGGRVHVPELGFIDEFETPETTNEPVGPAFVVLVHILSTPDGVGRQQGEVVRLSEIDARYADPKLRDKNINSIKANVKRLIENESIRVADDEEAQMDRVEVTLENESPAVRREREKRMALERRLREAGIDPNAPVESDEETEDEE